MAKAAAVIIVMIPAHGPLSKLLITIVQVRDSLQGLLDALLQSNYEQI